MRDYDNDGIVDGVVIEEIPVNPHAIAVAPAPIKIGASYGVFKLLDASLFVLWLFVMHWQIRNGHNPFLGLPVLLLRVFWFFPQRRDERRFVIRRGHR
ncbi:MAG: hypothetical protein QY332_10550 [Anaerolineales bacterium]|nr:MAG: hypothetical protein QY332_10550 [Anaerolineales bacterium]